MNGTHMKVNFPFFLFSLQSFMAYTGLSLSSCSLFRQWRDINNFISVLAYLNLSLRFVKDLVFNWPQKLNFLLRKHLYLYTFSYILQQLVAVDMEIHELPEV